MNFPPGEVVQDFSWGGPAHGLPPRRFGRMRAWIALQGSNIGDGVDRQQMESLQSGSAEAFRDLYEKLAPSVYRTAFAIVRDADMAEDVVQDTFVAVHQHLDGFRGDSELKTWISRIALNRARDCLRRRKRAPRRLEMLEQEDGRTLESRADLSVEPERTRDHGLMARIQAEIERLPASLRECFLLREIGELSYEEIAEAMNLPLGTVRTHLFRARERLRKELGQVREEVG